MRFAKGPHQKLHFDIRTCSQKYPLLTASGNFCMVRASVLLIRRCMPKVTVFFQAYLRPELVLEIPNLSGLWLSHLRWISHKFMEGQVFMLMDEKYVCLWDFPLAILNILMIKMKTVGTNVSISNLILVIVLCNSAKRFKKFSQLYL